MLQILENHKQQWDNFFDRRFYSVVNSDARQWEIIKSRKLIDKLFLGNWRMLVREQRKTWIDTWGINGSYQKNLKAWQEWELSDAYVSPDELELFQEMLGCQDWGELQREHVFIRDMYKKDNEEIPMAVQRRLGMEIDLYRKGWNGLSPEIQTQQWSILNKDDIRHQVKSLNDLWTVYHMILHIYQKPELLPLSYKKRLAFEVEQFWKEVDPTLANDNL